MPKMVETDAIYAAKRSDNGISCSWVQLENFYACVNNKIFYMYGFNILSSWAFS